MACTVCKLQNISHYNYVNHRELYVFILVASQYTDIKVGLFRPLKLESHVRLC